VGKDKGEIGGSFLSSYWNEIKFDILGQRYWFERKQEPFEWVRPINIAL